jgi:hypothetical protein
VPITIAARLAVDEAVGIVGNVNIRRASPVHHHHSIWRCFAEAARGTELHG